LIAFGCKKILFKLDNNGFGFELNLDDILKCIDADFTKFTNDMFLQFCILSGCDYTESIKSVGTTKAYKIVNEYKDYKTVRQSNKI